MSSTAACECLDKAARLCVSTGDFGLAYATFESIGIQFLDSNLLKFTAKRYFLNAIFSILATGDAELAKNKLGEYKARDYTLASSVQCSFADVLINAVAAGDASAYADVVLAHDRHSPLDPWTTSVLLQIKNALIASTFVNLT